MTSATGWEIALFGAEMSIYGCKIAGYFLLIPAALLDWKGAEEIPGCMKCYYFLYTVGGVG